MFVFPLKLNLQTPQTISCLIKRLFSDRWQGYRYLCMRRGVMAGLPWSVVQADHWHAVSSIHDHVVHDVSFDASQCCTLTRRYHYYSFARSTAACYFILLQWSLLMSLELVCSIQTCLNCFTVWRVSFGFLSAWLLYGLVAENHSACCLEWSPTNAEERGRPKRLRVKWKGRLNCSPSCFAYPSEDGGIVS